LDVAQKGLLQVLTALEAVALHDVLEAAVQVQRPRRVGRVLSGRPALRREGLGDVPRKAPARAGSVLEHGAAGDVVSSVTARFVNRSS
jgi:hypothetical protein